MTERHLEFSQIATFLDTKYPHHHDAFAALPAEIAAAVLRANDDEWSVAGRDRDFRIPEQAVDVFLWWRDGRDHGLMLQLRREYEMEVATQYEVGPEVPSNRFDVLRVQEGYESDGEDEYLPHWRQNFDVDADSVSEASQASSIDQLFPEYSWTPPATDRPDRPVSEILELDDIWTLSLVERKRLLRHWADELVSKQAPQLDLLRNRLATINAHIKTIENQGKLELIRNAKIIGCTTNSCAPSLRRWRPD